MSTDNNNPHSTEVEATAEQLKQELQKALDSSTAAVAASTDAVATEPEASAQGWLIEFRPDADILRTGNEPFRMVREICEVVGKEAVTVSVDSSALADIQTLDPENLF